MSEPVTELKRQRATLKRLCEGAEDRHDHQLVDLLMPAWKLVNNRITKARRKIILTAAGPSCSICGRGVDCWLAPDESPCKCLTI